MIRRERDKARLSSFLNRYEVWAGYATCDLEEDMFSKCEWYVAEQNGEIVSLCLYFKGFDPATQISFGDSSGVEEIVRLVSNERLRFQIPLEHRDVMEKHYDLQDLKLMSRMVATKETFKPVEGSAIRMHERDLPRLEKFYSSRQESYFRSYMLSSGVYYGIAQDGYLVSAAGTHVVSPTYGVACIGNVFTSPPHRRRGYASTCTSKLVEELLKICKSVILNVDSNNLSAIKLYRKLGFTEHCRYIEGSACRYVAHA